MKITSPSGRVYNWDKSTPPTDADMQALIEFDAQQNQVSAEDKARLFDWQMQQADEMFKDKVPQEQALQSLESEMATLPKPATSLAQRIREGMVGRALLGPSKRQIAQDQAVLQRAGYAPQTIAKMQPEVGLLEKSANKAVNTADMVGEMGVQGFVPAMAQAAAAEFSGPLAPVTVPLAGAVTGAGVNALVQGKRMLFGQQEGFRKGEMAANAVTSAIPGGTVAKAGIGKFAFEAGKAALINNVALATQNALDTDPTYQNLIKSSEQAAMQGDFKAAEDFKNQASNYRWKQRAFATAAGVGGVSLGKYLDKQSNKLALKVESARIAGKGELDLVREIQKTGMALPPNILNKENKELIGKINKMSMETSGPGDTAMTMMDRNQKIQQELIRKQIYETPYGQEVARRMNLDPNTPFTKEILDNIRKAADAPYNQLSNAANAAKQEAAALQQSVFTVPTNDGNAAFKLKALKDVANTDQANKLRSLQIQAGADIDEYLKAKYKLDVYHEARRTKTDPEVLDKIAEQSKTVAEIEKRIDAGVREMGMPDLFNDIKKAREIQAQVHEVEKALQATGNVDASTLAASGAPFTGNLKLIADMQNNFGKYLGDASHTKPVDTTKLSMFLAGTAGSATAALTKDALITGSAFPLGFAAGAYFPKWIAPKARELVLSDWYQRKMTQPYYGYTIPDFNASTAKYIMMDIGRKNSQTKE